jgi:hypothetical protein
MIHGTMHTKSLSAVAGACTTRARDTLVSSHTRHIVMCTRRLRLLGASDDTPHTRARAPLGVCPRTRHTLLLQRGGLRAGCTACV